LIRISHPWTVLLYYNRPWMAKRGSMNQHLQWQSIDELSYCIHNFTRMRFALKHHWKTELFDLHDSFFYNDAKKVNIIIPQKITSLSIWEKNNRFIKGAVIKKLFHFSHFSLSLFESFNLLINIHYVKIKHLSPLMLKWISKATEKFKERSRWRERFTVWGNIDLGQEYEIHICISLKTSPIQGQNYLQFIMYFLIGYT